MKRSALCAVAGFTMVLAGCGLIESSSTDPISSPGLRQLRDHDLHELIDGSVLNIDRRGEGIVPVHEPTGIRWERYCDGLRTSRSDRVPFVTHPYAIGGGQVCVDTGAQQYCRRVFRNRAGEYFIQDVRGANSPSPLSPLTASRDESCVAEQESRQLYRRRRRH